MTKRRKTTISTSEPAGTLGEALARANRPAPHAAGLVEAYAERSTRRAARAALTSVTQTERIKAEEAAARALSVTSPEMASLAAAYMQHEDPDVRRLAASVLRQTESL